MTNIESLDTLNEFSHVWITFKFHLNTNTVKVYAVTLILNSLGNLGDRRLRLSRGCRMTANRTPLQVNVTGRHF